MARTRPCIDDDPERRSAARQRGLARAHAARRRAASGSPDPRSRFARRRLDSFRAHTAAALLERNGWRAEAVPLGQGVALVEVRDLATRGHPLVAVLRHPGQAEAWLAARGHGLRGRVPAPPKGVSR
jgi:hypothetical protein